MSTFALTGARIFDGAILREGQAVLIEGERIAAVVAERDLTVGIERRTVEGLIAPGFIDIQVNGGGGYLLNEDRSVAGIARIGKAHRPFGTTGYLPTLITSSREHMQEAVAAAKAALSARTPGVLGVHLEGPFLSPERKGVHDPRFMRPIDEADFALITSITEGRVLLTIAPEMVPLSMIERLAKAGVVLSAGHTKAGYEVVREARAMGLAGFTHLFNAMPPLAGREPGPVGAALDDPDAWASIIVDLHHVSAASLRVAIAARGWERTILITDGMWSIGADTDTFFFDGRRITLRDGMLKTDDRTLAGSHLDMAAAVRNTIRALGLPLEAALHMASRAPAEFLGLGQELGRIAPGYRASLVRLDDDLEVVETWIDGVSSKETVAAHG